MREQMQFRDGRLSWLLFNVFLMIFFAGFFFAPGAPVNWHLALWVAFGFGLVLAYTRLISQSDALRMSAVGHDSSPA